MPAKRNIRKCEVQARVVEINHVREFKYMGTEGGKYDTKIATAEGAFQKLNKELKSGK